MLRFCNPDIVLLQEATDSGTFERVRSEAAMPEGACRPGHSLAFMSRIPIARHAWHKPRWSRHAFLELVLPDETTRLFGLHLSAVHAAWTERRRQVELRALLATIRRHQHGPHVLVGDFNTLAPGEALQIDRLPPRLRPFIWLSGGRIRWRTIQTVLDAGYTDAFRRQHPDDAGMTFPTWDPHVRLDYIFLSEALAPRLTRCDVIRTPETLEASDHFPLLAEVE